jgi:PAS domain S-box-containing protein
MKFTIHTKLLLGFSFFVAFSLIIQVLAFLTIKQYIPNFQTIEAFFLILLVPTAVLMVIAFLISGNLTKSIRTLNQSVTEVSQGQLHPTVVIKSGDEIEDLSVSFASLVQQLLQRESTMKNEKQETEIILQSLSDGVVVLNQENKIMVFNKAAERLSGFGFDQVKGKSVDEVLHFYENMEIIPYATYNDQSEIMVRKLKEKGISMGNSKGEKMTVSLTIAPVIFEDQRKGSIITFHDVSKESELEEMKLDFVSMAAHELRTPLTAIRGYADLIQMQNAEDLDDTGKELINRLQISSANLGNLIDNLLSVSRIERNMFSVDVKPVDLTKTIGGVVDNLRQTAETKQQKIIFNKPNELPVVIADAFRISQVLANLVANAINYTQESGTITVTVEKIEGFLEVSVTDNGPGIPAEALKKLFTKFFRVSGALEQGSKGTGLGLFISKSIINMHNGKIWVESEIGKGSKFIFTLPLAGTQDIANYQLAANKSDLTIKNGQGIIIKKT